MRVIPFISFVLLFSQVSWAQQLRFYAQADALSISDQQTVNVTFTVENMDLSGFSPPEFDWFEVVAGPMLSTQMSIVNGKSSQSGSMTYTLLPTKTGKLKIPPATLRHKGKQYETKPIEINVTAADNINNATLKDQDFIVKVELSDSVAYVGQQIHLDIVLFNTVEISSFDVTNMPEFEGFYKEYVPGIRQTVNRQTINGKTYYRRVLQRLALFPQKPVVYQVEPITVKVGIPQGSSRGFFFSQRNTKNQYIKLDPFTITAIPLPEGAPSTFGGGVGAFKINANIDKNQLTTDDAVILQLEVLGDGDVRRWSAPKLDVGAEWETYEPNEILREQPTNEYRIQNRVVYEYLLVPKKVGKLSLKPQYTYFDPIYKSYNTLSSNAQSIEVTQGTRKITQDDRDVSSIAALTPAYTQFQSRNPRSKLFGGTLHWGLMALGLGAMGWIYTLKRKKDAYDALDDRVKNKLKADQQWDESFSFLHTYLDRNDYAGFYAELSLAIKQYLEYKMGQPLGDKSSVEIVAMLQSSNIDEDDAMQFKSILDFCSHAIYSGGANASKAKDMLQLSNKVVAKIKASL